MGRGLVLTNSSAVRHRRRAHAPASTVRLVTSLAVIPEQGVVLVVRTGARRWPPGSSVVLSARDGPRTSILGIPVGARTKVVGEGVVVGVLGTLHVLVRPHDDVEASRVTHAHLDLVTSNPVPQPVTVREEAGSVAGANPSIDARRVLVVVESPTALGPLSARISGSCAVVACYEVDEAVSRALRGPSFGAIVVRTRDGQALELLERLPPACRKRVILCLDPHSALVDQSAPLRAGAALVEPFDGAALLDTITWVSRHSPPATSGSEVPWSRR